MVSQLEAETLPKVTCMVYFEVSMACPEIYTKCFKCCKFKGHSRVDCVCGKVYLYEWSLTC